MSERRGELRGERCVTIAEAAGILGISKDAVRMRVQRDTLRHEKGEDGRVYVFLNADANADPNAVTNAAGRDEFVEELRDRVRFLEDQLQQANERDRENRRIVAALTSRIPELEAPQEPRESPESPGPARTPTDADEGPQEGAQWRSWWRRIFGG